MANYIPLVFIVENDFVKSGKISHDLINNTHYKFEFFSTSDECLRNLHRKPLAVCVDYEMDSYDSHERDGHRFLDEINAAGYHTEVVFFSQKEDYLMVKEVIKWGAYDYVTINDDNFHRLENILFNIEEKVVHQVESKKYKTMLIITAVVLVGWILVLLFMYNNGQIHGN